MNQIVISKSNSPNCIKNSSEQHYKRMLNYPTIETIKLGIFFLLIFTAYTSFQTIITQIYQNQGLSGVGPLNFIMNYLTFMVSSIFAPKCKASFKTQMIIGCIGHGFNIATGLYVPYIHNKWAAYGVISLGGIVAGSVAGYLWISQGGYLREVVKNEKDKGKYSSIFKFLYSFSSIIAGFVTTFFLGYFEKSTYFIVLIIIPGMAAVFAFFYFHDLKQSPQSIQEIKNGPGVWQELKSTFKFYSKMAPVLVMLLLDGVVLSMYCNQVIRLMPEENDQQKRNRLVGIITIFIGLGSMCGAFFVGFASDRFGLLSTGRFTIFFYFLCTVATSVAIYQGTYYFICFVGFMWGSAYYLFQGWIYVAILKIYNGRLQAFSINKQLHCVSFASFQTIVLLTNNQIDLKILLPIIALFAIPSVWSIGKANYQKEALLLALPKSILTQEENQYSSVDYGQQKNT